MNFEIMFYGFIIGSIIGNVFWHITLQNTKKELNTRKKRCVELERRVTVLSKTLKDNGFSNKDIVRLTVAESVEILGELDKARPRAFIDDVQGE